MAILQAFGFKHNSFIAGRNFDIADRTFRKLATTWLLSSSESATDVKELIPEFFYFPEFLVNQERRSSLVQL